MPKRLLFLLAITLLCAACSNYKHIRNTLDEVETYIEARPDSALAVLSDIDKALIRNRASKAQYSLLHAKALDKNDVATTDLTIIQPAVDYYSNTKDFEHYAESLMYYGVFQSNAGEYPAAIVTFTRAEKLLDKIDNPHLSMLLYSAMAHIFGKSSDWDQELKYANLAYEKCVEDADSTRMHLLLYIVANANNNALHHPVADSLYSALLSDASTPNNIRHDVLSSYGFLKVVRPQPDYKSAKRLFEQAIEESGKLTTVNHWGCYALTLSMAGDNSYAEKILQAIKKDDEANYLYWKSMVECVQSDYESAYRDLNASLQIRDMAVLASLNHSASKAQRDYLSAENERQSSKIRQKNVSIIIILLVFIIIIGAIGVIISRFRRKIDQERFELLQNMETVYDQLNDMEGKYHEAIDENRVLQHSIDNERQELRAGYIQMYKTQFDFFKEIGKAVIEADINNRGKKEDIKYKEVHDKARAMIKDIIADEDGQKRFEAELDRRMDGVMTKFRTDFPNLKSDDYRVACFIFAQFNANLISMLCPSITMRAAQTRKYRLKNMILDSESNNKDLYLGLLN